MSPRVDVASLVPVRRLGRGTLCEVMLVEDAVGRRYALKRALPEHRDNAGVVRLMRDEGRVAEKLVHPAIPRLLGFHEGRDGPELVFELLDGTTLDELLPKKRALSLAAAAFVVDTVLDALGYVHALPSAVIHRDVGAHNVVVTRSGDPALIDFGIARDEDRERWTAAGAMRGTLGYLAPEAVRGEPVDARADLFAAGALFYRLVTGHGAFRGKGPRQILDALSRADFTRAADVEPSFAALDPFFAAALTAAPAARFPDAASMRLALARISTLGALDDAARTRARSELAALVAPHLSSTEPTRGPTLS